MDHDEDLKMQIGEAWKSHYAGQNETAVSRFKALADEHPDNIDVLWGLGLAYRQSGDLEAALAIFKQVETLVTGKVDNQSSDYERYFMLSRMVKQQISHLDEFLR